MCHTVNCCGGCLVGDCFHSVFSSMILSRSCCSSGGSCCGSSMVPINWTGRCCDSAMTLSNSCCSDGDIGPGGGVGVGNLGGCEDEAVALSIAVSVMISGGVSSARTKIGLSRSGMLSRTTGPVLSSHHVLLLPSEEQEP